MTVSDTIFNRVTIDNNDIKRTILNNEPIEENLHVIIAISNPCEYKTRYILTMEFIERMKFEKNVILYVVELAYNSQEFIITQSDNPRHLQLRTKVPIWHKENMINCGVKILPPDWKAFAWVDADLEFESTTWAADTLKLLNGSKDIVQLFSHCIDMDVREDCMNIWQSFGYQYCKRRPYIKSGLRYWHSGYAWAITRKAYETIGGLYDISPLGAGDHNMAMSLIGKGLQSMNVNTTDDYKRTLLKFEDKAKYLRLGYVPGVIRHFYHGSKKNRKYMERWKLLVDNRFEPTNHLAKDENGVLVPTADCPMLLLAQIMNYFNERNEDENCEGKNAKM